MIINLGGEGEEPGAVNVNAFIEPTMMDRRFERLVSEELVVRRSADDTGLPDSCADVVVANNFPIHFDQLIVKGDGERQSITSLATEVVRILRPGGRVDFGCSSCDRPRLAQAFRIAGLETVMVSAGGRVKGRKPWHLK